MRPNDHHILGLHVPVNETVAVDRVESAQELADPVDGKRPRYGTDLAEQTLQVRPLHELHGDQIFVGGLGVRVADALVQVEARD